MSLAILAFGTALPTTTISGPEGEAMARVLCYQDAERQSWLASLYKGIGIDKRHSGLSRQVIDDVLQGTRISGSFFLPENDPSDQGPTVSERMEIYKATAGPLALRAARQALDRSGRKPHDITHLVTVSCTGFAAPGVDVELIRGLGLPPSTERTHVGFMGCHGALNGLRVARAFAGSDPASCVLVCAVELCCLHYFYGWDPQKIVANALFGDGAAAVLGVSASIAPSPHWKLAASGSYLLPDSLNAMTWNLSDHGFEMTLSKKVPQLIATYLRPWLKDWLGGHGLTLEEIRSWAIHPGGPRIVEAAEEALALPRERSAMAREVFRQYGNMSSPTILFILKRMQETGSERPCVALGFGPGLNAEAALFV
jgi:predicted naringenin-chalcone synthase